MHRILHGPAAPIQFAHPQNRTAPCRLSYVFVKGKPKTFSGGQQRVVVAATARYKLLYRTNIYTYIYVYIYDECVWGFNIISQYVRVRVLRSSLSLQHNTLLYRTVYPPPPPHHLCISFLLPHTHKYILRHTQTLCWRSIALYANIFLYIEL